jgi:hypothetical protein
VAATAESGRVRNRSADTFDKFLKTLPQFLSRKNSSGHTNLFTFFQPQPGTSRLFRVFSAGLNATGSRGAVRIGWKALRTYWLVALIGALPGGVIVAVACKHPASWLVVLSLIAGVVGLLIGAAVAVVLTLVLEFGRSVPGTGRR